MDRRFCVDYRRLNEVTCKDSYFLPFGLCNASETFQQLMERVQSGMPPQNFLVCLDDLLVHGSTFSETLDTLQQALQRLEAAGCKLHPDKCRFMLREITFLDIELVGGGITTEPAKLSAVRDWSVPTSQRVMGVSGAGIILLLLCGPLCHHRCSPTSAATQD